MNLKIVQRKWPVEGDDDSVLASAREALLTQAEALEYVADRLGPSFCRAVDLLSVREGRVVVCGMGKSGLIARKIAATFACSGTPSLFLHAGDAAHGDLGMVTRSDVLLLVSHSGTTEELVGLLPYFDELGVPIVALVGDSASPLARAAHVVLCTFVEREVCPHNVVVTTSALVSLGLADALALAVMRRREISVGELGRRHPRGALGRRLTQRVSELMQAERLPLVSPELALREALVTMASGRCGVLIVIDAAGSPVGLVTEAELRAYLTDGARSLDLPVEAIMTADPATIREDASSIAAEEKMRRLNLETLVVVDARERVSGVMHGRVRR